jgi:hypothetical protein
VGRRISRRVKSNPGSDLTALFNFIFSVPTSYLLPRVEALAVLPGMGEDWRIIQAIGEWENRNNIAHHFFIAGFNQAEKTTTATDIETLKQYPFSLKVVDNVCIQPEASNTKDQAEWILSMAREEDIKSLAIFAPIYHLPRAYLTILKTFLKNNFRIVLVPAPVFISPNIIIPEARIDSWAMFPGEMERVVAYQGKGDVATLGELREYFAWLWQQPLLQF